MKKGINKLFNRNAINEELRTKLLELKEGESIIVGTVKFTKLEETFVDVEIQ